MSEAFLIGSWESIEQLEDSITLHELYAILEALRDQEERFAKVIFASQGHDISSEEKDEVRMAVEERAKKRLEEIRGVDKVRESEFSDLNKLGIGFELVGE